MAETRGNHVPVELPCISTHHIPTQNAYMAKGKLQLPSEQHVATIIAASRNQSKPIFNGPLQSDGTNIYHGVDIFP